MKKLFLTTLVLSTLASPAFADHIVQIHVNGMVCDFCARAIEKVFMKQDAVEGIDVNLDEKLITATLKDGQTLDDEAIAKLVSDSGYALEEIVRGGGHE